MVVGVVGTAGRWGSDWGRSVSHVNLREKTCWVYFFSQKNHFDRAKVLVFQQYTWERMQ